MPFFGNGQSSADPGQNTQLLSLSQRLSAIEAYNLGNRLVTLEQVIANLNFISLVEKGAPLGVATLDEDGTVLSSQLMGSVLAQLVGANMEAVDALSDEVAAIPPPPTLTSLGGEPVGSANAAIVTHKTESEPHNQYAKLTQLPTLLSLGGEPTGAETRAKSYTDSKTVGLAGYPTNHVHIWGYGKAPTGKNFVRTTNTASELGFHASISPSAVGDVVEYEIPLKSGNYILTVYGQGATNRRNAAILINNQFVGTLNFYEATTNNRAIRTLPFSVATTGLTSIKVLNAGGSAVASENTLSLSVLRIDPDPFISSSYSVQAVRINCGGVAVNYTDSESKVWSPNLYWAGGGSAYNEAQLGTENLVYAGTTKSPIYRTETSADNSSFSYSLPILTSGLYNLELGFCENFHSSAGQRVGSVALNGVNILSSFDVFAEAGGRRKPITKVFSNLNLSQCVLTFTNTLINAIELIKL